MDLFQLLGGSSMESTYLQMIAFLDQAETLANNQGKKVVPSNLALAISEVKQRVIEEFAKTNAATTLKSVQERAEALKTTTD